MKSALIGACFCIIPFVLMILFIDSFSGDLGALLTVLIFFICQGISYWRTQRTNKEYEHSFGNVYMQMALTNLFVLLILKAVSILKLISIFRSMGNAPDTTAFAMMSEELLMEILIWVAGMPLVTTPIFLLIRKLTVKP